MQESLSQFMCHTRSTTERHYRHHMSHRSLWPVFNELSRCQALPSEDTVVSQALSSEDSVVRQALPSEDTVVSQVLSSEDSVVRQALPSGDTVITIPLLDCDLSLENTSISHNSTGSPTLSNTTKDHYAYVSDLDNEDLQNSSSEDELETSLVSEFQRSLNGTFTEVEESIIASKNEQLESVSNCYIHPP